MFEKRLKVLWEDKPLRMVEAFFDNTVVKQEVIHKVIEVKVHDEHNHHKRPYPQGMTREKIPAQKRIMSVLQDDMGANEINDTDVTEKEKMLIVEDVKTIKTAINSMRKRTEAISQGTRGWFNQFDINNSDRIELAEFKKMLQSQELKFDERITTMLYLVFDRNQNGHFSFAEFDDIINQNLIPNYAKIIKRERKRWAKDGDKFTSKKQSIRPKMQDDEFKPYKVERQSSDESKKQTSTTIEI